MTREKNYLNAVCVECGKDFKLYHGDITGNMTKCAKCYKAVCKLEKEAHEKIAKAREIEQQFRIKETKKKLKGKDPYEVLAHLKLMLHRSKSQFRQSRGGWWISPHDSDSKEGILKECEDILEAYDIPSKYLIAETLDSNEE